MTWGDISREDDDSGRVLIAKSETDQTGEGAVVYISPATMDALDAIRPADVAPEARVFGLTPDTIGRRVRAACAAAGLPAGYSGHSPRVGMATALVRWRAALPEVMQAGRWQGPAMVSRYAAKELAGRGAVARRYERGELGEL